MVLHVALLFPLSIICLVFSLDAYWLFFSLLPPLPGRRSRRFQNSRWRGIVTSCGNTSWVLTEMCGVHAYDRPLKTSAAGLVCITILLLYYYITILLLYYCYITILPDSPLKTKRRRSGAVCTIRDGGICGPSTTRCRFPSHSCCCRPRFLIYC